MSTKGGRPPTGQVAGNYVNIEPNLIIETYVSYRPIRLLAHLRSCRLVPPAQEKQTRPHGSSVGNRHRHDRQGLQTRKAH